MKTDVKYSLSSGRDGLIDGSIFLGDKEYYLDMISEDIIDALSAVTGRSVNVGFFVRNPVSTVEDIPASYRTDALEVKLRLMALIKDLDQESAIKLQAFEDYHSRCENEISRHHNAMKRIGENFHERLRELGA